MHTTNIRSSVASDNDHPMDDVIHVGLLDQNPTITRPETHTTNATQVTEARSKGKGKAKAKLDVPKQKKAKIVHQEESTLASSSDESESPMGSETSSTNTSSLLSTPRTHKKRQNPAKQPTTTCNVQPNEDKIRTTEEISEQALRFAETRYPFPPFVVKFPQNVDEARVVQHLTNHYKQTANHDLKIAGLCLKLKRDLLIFVDSMESFAQLYDESSWPISIGEMNYTKQIPTHLPPQFSLVLRNIPRDYDTEQMLTDIQQTHHAVIGAHRILNAEKTPTSFIRLDIRCPKALADLLAKKFIYVNQERFTITEYIAPAKVLLCNKCFQIGHFHSTCKNTMAICKRCGKETTDENKHIESCNSTPCCIRCKGSHESNGHRCPVIRSYRSVLTKSLINRPPNKTSSQPVTPPTNNDAVAHPHRHPTERSAWTAQNTTTNMDERIEEMITKLGLLEKNMNKMIEINTKLMDETIRTQKTTDAVVREINVITPELLHQKEYINKLVSPVCQMVLELIPALVRGNIILDHNSSGSPLTSRCDQLAKEIASWTNQPMSSVIATSIPKHTATDDNKSSGLGSSTRTDHAPSSQ